jgi:adenylate cyclase
MSENGFGRFPWPRDTYVVLLDYLARARPRVVVFDVLFLEEDTATGGEVPGPEADRQFVEATRKAGNVIHAIEVNDTVRMAPRSKPRLRFDLGPSIEEHQSMKLPFPALADAARMLGHTFMVLDSDGPIRRAVPFVRHGEVCVPSLPLAAVLAAKGLGPGDVALEPGGLRIGSTVVPLAEFRQEYVDVQRVRHMLVPYQGPPYTDGSRTTTTYRSFRFWDLFVSELALGEGKKPEVDPATFRDKVIFIGTSAAGLHDVFQTPFGEAGKMPGMQIHANVVDGILNRSFIEPANPGFMALLLAVSTLLVGFSGVYLGFWWSLVAAAVTLLLDAALAAWTFKSGVWLPCTPTVLGVSIAQFSAVGYRYFVEDKAKRQVRSLFSRYVSPAVVKELVDDPSRARLGGQRREMSVLFSDIRGFTTFSEAGQPEDVIRQLNEYFTHMVDLLFHHQGTLDKFVGDMIMALFGAPIEDPDHADHAVRMGLGMLDGLDKLNAAWRAQGRPTFDIGIGINTGDMIVGNVGSEKTLSYTVIGDNVNLGSRLESLNKQYGTHIIISEATLRKLKGSYHVRPLGQVKVKGKTKDVSIFEVCRSREEWLAREAQAGGGPAS